jgi:HEAT repeat protein
MPYPPRPEPWRQWYRTEQGWRSSEAARALADLGGDETAAEPAVRSLAQHPLYRHELAPALAPALRHTSAAVRRLACDALARLGSWTAVDALVRALDDADPSVAEAAHAALVRLTGWDQPHRSEAWRLALLEIRRTL